MKLDAVLSYVLAILEGCLAGACCCQAGKEKRWKRKTLWYIASAAWFVLSLLDGTEGGRTLRDARTTDPGEEEAPA